MAITAPSAILNLLFASGAARTPWRPPDGMAFALPVDTNQLAETIQSYDPLLLIGGGVAVLLVLGLLAVVIRRLRRTRGDELQRVLAEYDTVSVLMHPNPDPDAMACAMGVAALAENVHTEAVLQYSGQIRHQENRAFRTVLNLEFDRIEEASDLAAEDAVVLVDHNTARGFPGSKSLEPIAVIDHHPGNGTGTEFTDVRDGYGASSTLCVEYLHEVGAVIEKQNGNGKTDAGNDTIVITPELATGLVYGIHSDTDRLTRGCSTRDFDACSWVFTGIDEDLLDRIANPKVSHNVLKTKATAITNIMVEGSFGVVNVGEIENVDAISQAADELMHLEGVTAVVVYGKNNGTLNLSGRSRDDRVHMGNSLRHAVKDIPMANAGGHARMGGGQVSLGHLNGLGSADGVSFDEFNERLFTAMAGER